jgi:hypothetical protein
MTIPQCTRGFAFLAGLLAVTATLPAQDNSTLLNLLIRKGVLSEQEADDVRADLAKENSAALVTTSKTNNLEKLSLTTRMQTQFVRLATDAGGSVADPARNQHFFQRRIYFGVRAQFAANWSSYLNYDFAGSTFDQATITWKPSERFVLDLGLRKVPFGYDEWSISSGALKSIERSTVTRFFVESNNGRRLGAGSYHQGVFLGGTSDNGEWSYNVAVTNPERGEDAITVVPGVGNATNNTFSYWANAGYTKKFGPTLLNSLKLGVSAGFLPEQGGPTNANLGKGYDLTVYSAYADLYVGPYSLVAEYYWADNERGVSLTRDAKPTGFWIQPSYRFGAFEPVVRYSFTDSDGRGIVPGDLVRSAPNPTGLTFDHLCEWYTGVNWYPVGNDLKHEVKVQAGYIHARSTNRLTGAATVDHLTSDGLRSQVQVNF